MLRNKDEAVELPDGWEYVRKNKNAFLLRKQEAGRFEHLVTGQCLNKCWQTSHISSVVNVQESECQTNCMTKACEVRAIFEYMNLKEDGKKSIVL